MYFSCCTVASGRVLFCRWGVCVLLCSFSSLSLSHLFYTLTSFSPLSLTSTHFPFPLFLLLPLITSLLYRVYLFFLADLSWVIHYQLLHPQNLPHRAILPISIRTQRHRSPNNVIPISLTPDHPLLVSRHQLIAAYVKLNPRLRSPALYAFTTIPVYPTLPCHPKYQRAVHDESRLHQPIRSLTLENQHNSSMVSM